MAAPAQTAPQYDLPPEAIPGASVDVGVAAPESDKDLLIDRPSNPYLYTTPTGIPVYGKGAPVLYRAPAGPGQGPAPDATNYDLPPEATPPAQTPAAQAPAPDQRGLFRQVLDETLNMPRQWGAGIVGQAAGLNHIIANTAMMLDHSQKALADITGMPKGEFFKHVEDWARAQQQYGEQQEQQISGGRKDFNSQVFRGMGAMAAGVPAMEAAAAVGGPIAGMAALSGLETADQGWKPALTAAAQGAVMGKAMELAGPAPRLVRGPVMAGANYASLRAQGVDPETAAANAATTGAFSALPPGELSTGQTLKTMSGNPFAGLADPQKLAENQQAAAAAKAAQDQRSAEAQRIIDLGKKYNVTLTAGDISQRPSLKNVEIAAEKVPGLGMQTLREKQAQQVKAAASDVKSQYGQALLETDPSSLTDLQEAAQGGDQRARNVMEKMQQAGDDPDRIIQASIGLGDWTTRQTSTKLYDRVQDLAEQHELGDVPMDTTGKAIEGALNQLRPAKLKNNEVINLLQKIKESVSPQTDAKGKPVKPNNSYALIRQLHSDLGDRIREYYQGNNALIGEKGVGYLERVQNALEDDMRNYAQSSNVPEIVQAGRQADDYYKSARVPYKNGMLAAAATSSEPDQVFQQFIKAGKKDRAQNFYDSLDEKGRAAVRYNMVAKAVDDAINPQSGIFSPQKFFTAVDKLGDAYDVFFTAKDKAEIQGFKNLMGHVTRAGQYAENPPTGQRAIPIILAGEALRSAKDIGAHPFVTGGAVALLGGARALLTTTRGRNLLLRAYGIRPGSRLMESVWRDVGSEIGKGRPPEPPPEEPPTGPAAPGSSAPPPAGPAPTSATPASAAPASATAEEPAQGVLPFHERMQNMADDAMARMHKRGTFDGTKLNALVPVDDMKDMAIWGAAKIAQGVKNRTAWGKEILDDVGEHAERFRPLLPKLWLDSQKAYDRFLGSTSGLPNTRQLIRMFNEGRAGAEWYDKTRDELHKVFGQKDGDLMIRLLAATSPNTTVPANVTLALKAFRQIKYGQDFQGEAGKPGYLPVVKDMLKAIRYNGDEDAIGGLKVQSFRKNLLGETDPVTIDRWMKRIFNFKSKGSITDPQYKFMDYQVTRLAKKLNMEPRQVQAALWKAIRESSGETSSGAPFEELIQSRLRKNPVLRQLAEQSKAESQKEPTP